jgi:hypothetical protein
VENLRVFLVKCLLAAVGATTPAEIVRQSEPSSRSILRMPFVTRSHLAGQVITEINPRYFVINSHGDKVVLNTVFEDYEMEDEDEEEQWQVIQNPRSKPIPIRTSRKVRFADDEL